MSNRKTLVRAYQVGHLLEAVQAALSPDRDERARLASDLAALHNEGQIDLIVAFGALTKSSASGLDFFLLRQVFEELLPQIEAPIPELIRCVLHLYREAGVDGAAGTILDAFQEYCASRAERPQAALAEVEAEPDRLATLLGSVLVAGSRINSSAYIAETIRLSKEANLDLRKRALFALGRLHGEMVNWANEDVARTLEQAVAAETDDQALASAITSIWSLAQQGKPGSRPIAAIEVALSRGGEAALHAASEVFGFRAPEAWPELLDLFLERLILVEPTNKGTVDNIDYGLARLLQGKHKEVGLSFLEKVLRLNPEGLELTQFDDAVRAIRNDPALCSRVVTRWLLSGDATLCEGLNAIVDAPMGNEPEIEANAGELDAADPVRFVFAARKAIGFLFLKPISVTSFLLSLMRQAPDARVRGDLEALLLNPLLINFSGRLVQYLERRVESEEDDEVRVLVRRALEGLEGYLGDLRSIGEMPALYPSLERREAYHRYFSEKVAQSLKEAQAESLILQLVHRSVLLYGRKAIHHVFGPDGEINRMEVELGRQGTEIEVPRMMTLDPEGLDFMLRVFRYEEVAE